MDVQMSFAEKIRTSMDARMEAVARHARSIETDVRSLRERDVVEASERADLRDRMAEVAELAAAVATDARTLLAADEDPRLRDYLADVAERAERAVRLATMEELAP